jgi:hypothetical protein
MNALRLPALAALALVILAGCQSAPVAPAPAQSADGRVTVNFQDQKNFTDAADDSFGETDQYILNMISKITQEEVGRQLAAGESIIITFLDVDLAGDFEPWRRAGADDVRYVKSIYPPRFVIAYERFGADGKSLAKGEDHVTNLAFQMQVGIRTDEYFYERQLLRDWARRVTKG